MRSMQRYLSWMALGTAFLLWAGVGYFASRISSEEFARTSRVLEEGQASTQHAAALRLRALVRETEGTRAQLDTIAHVEIVEILDAVEKVGRDAGVPIDIGQALFVPPSDPNSPVRVVALVVEAEGTFAELMHVATLLETLPTPSSVNEIQLERIPAGSGSEKSGSNVWHVVARMRFLTTADIAT